MSAPRRAVCSIPQPLPVLSKHHHCLGMHHITRSSSSFPTTASRAHERGCRSVGLHTGSTGTSIISQDLLSVPWLKHASTCRSTKCMARKENGCGCSFETWAFPLCTVCLSLMRNTMAATHTGQSTVTPPTLPVPLALCIGRGALCKRLMRRMIMSKHMQFKLHAKHLQMGCT